jgi:signal transduction histidine kinase
MNFRNVVKRHPLLLSLACLVVVLVVVLAEASYARSVVTLEGLAAVRDPHVSVEDLRWHVAESRGELRHTLQLSRIGVVVSSVVSLLALFLYLRQGLALEEHKQQAQRERERVVRIERDRLEVEVTRRTAELVQLTHHVQTAREDERSRLARDLHDELGALLTSAKLDAARIKMRLAGTAPEALERLANLVSTLNTGIALSRSIIENLRPSSLGHLGLLTTLENLAGEFRARSGVDVHLTLSPVSLAPAAELVLYRVVQEAITNVTKYAQAHQVWVSLREHDARVELSVRDDGVGFDAATASTSAYGLVGMRFRVEAEGGSMRVVSAPAQGTEIQVMLPQVLPSAS